MIWGFRENNAEALRQIDGDMDQHMNLQLIKDIGLQSENTLLLAARFTTLNTLPGKLSASLTILVQSLMQWPSQS